MSTTYATGDRVRFLGSDAIHPRRLPVGTTGTVVDQIMGHYLFFEADADSGVPEDLRRGTYGDGWALMAPEVEPLQ